MNRNQTSMSVYTSYELPAIQNVNKKALVYIDFTLLAYVPEQIYLPQCLILKLEATHSSGQVTLESTHWDGK